MGLFPSKPFNKTNSAEDQKIERSDTVTLTFGTRKPTELGSVEEHEHSVKFVFAAIPVNSDAERAQYNTGLHFHADKTECLQVAQGVVGVQLNQHKFKLTPEMGEIIVPPYCPHAWWLEGDGSKETILWERTVPGTREKEIFFRNLLGHLNDSTLNGVRPSILQFFTIFSRWDNYPILGGWVRGGGIWFAYRFTKTLGWVGTLAGYKPAYKEYTPSDLYATLA